MGWPHPSPRAISVDCDRWAWASDKRPVEAFVYGVAPNATQTLRWLLEELAGIPGCGLIPALGHKLHRRTGHQMMTLRDHEVLSRSRVRGFHVDLKVSVPTSIRIGTLAGDSITARVDKRKDISVALPEHTVGQIIRRALADGALNGLCNDEIAQVVIGDFEEDARELQVRLSWP